MLRLSMLLSCIFMTNSTALEKKLPNASTPSSSTTSSSHHQQFFATNSLINLIEKRSVESHATNADFDRYSVTCYICVNVSDNLVCNQFAIDRPCRPGETFCHTLHIMDSKGTSVLVNKKCTTERECQRNKVGCVEIDEQKMCVSCCDSNYCNVAIPTNSSDAIFDDKISKMRMLAKNLFREREKALTTTIKDANGGCATTCIRRNYLLSFIVTLFIYFCGG